MTPVATFPTLDDAESALDWIGLEFVERDGRFEGELSGDDRDLLEAAVEDADTPGPVRELARSLLGAWSGGDPEAPCPWAVTWQR